LEPNESIHKSEKKKMKDKRLDPNEFDLSEVIFLEHESHHELDDVDLSEIVFLEVLAEGEESEVFSCCRQGQGVCDESGM